uniref:Globin n=2 Tax=Ciona intestinalis TaxID=7719 RepID=Q70PH6_CIOIN|nr:globin precursor [Ciona intestinalis]CAD89600.1 globin [Ciona intestinalis]|eukprot:NP_001027701.1 globin precursor [Ciona intestinalis]
MKIICGLILFSTFAIIFVSGLNCWTCNVLGGNNVCRRSGGLRTCFNNQVCYNEVRRRGNTINIRKGCKNSGVCENHIMQSMSTPNPNNQCVNGPNYFCSCCCGNSVCNSNWLTCVTAGSVAPTVSTTVPPADEGLKRSDIINIQDSWNTLKGFGYETVGMLVLHRLFNDAPQTRYLFSQLSLSSNESFTLEQMRNNSRVVYHANRVARAVGRLVDLIELPTNFTDHLVWLGQRHAYHGVAPVNFDYMGPVLLETIKVNLELPSDSPTLSAWAKAYGVIKNGIKDAIIATYAEG